MLRTADRHSVSFGNEFTYDALLRYPSGSRCLELLGWKERKYSMSLADQVLEHQEDYPEMRNYALAWYIIVVSIGNYTVLNWANQYIEPSKTLAYNAVQPVSSALLCRAASRSVGRVELAPPRARGHVDHRFRLRRQHGDAIAEPVGEWWGGTRHHL